MAPAKKLKVFHITQYLSHNKNNGHFQQKCLNRMFKFELVFGKKVFELYPTSLKFYDLDLLSDFDDSCMQMGVAFAPPPSKIQKS